MRNGTKIGRWLVVVDLELNQIPRENWFCMVRHFSGHPHDD